MSINIFTCLGLYITIEWLLSSLLHPMGSLLNSGSMPLDSLLNRKITALCNPGLFSVNLICNRDMVFLWFIHASAYPFLWWLFDDTGSCMPCYLLKFSNFFWNKVCAHIWNCFTGQPIFWKIILPAFMKIHVLTLSSCIMTGNLLWQSKLQR